MLTYHVFKNGNRAKIYAYKRTILDITVPNAKTTALEIVSALNAGKVDYAIDCANWILEHGDCEHVNRSLGPHFFLRLEDKTVRDMSGAIVEFLEKETCND